MEDLREFLVSLGYDVKSTRDWDAALGKIDKLAARIMKGMAAAAAALTTLVRNSAESLDSLNFQSQRTGASVENLKAMAYAYRQSGASAADAGSAIEAFAARMRTIPATAGLVRMFGVATEQNGKLRDYADILLDITDKLNENPNYVQAYQQAGYFGLSEQQYWLFRRQGKQIRADRDAYLKDASRMGVGINAGGKSGTDLMQAFRFTSMQIEAAFDGVVLAIAPVLIPLVDQLNAWMQAHAGEIAKAAEWLVDKVSALIEWVWSLAVSLAPVAEAFDQFVQGATGEHGLVVALEAIGAMWMASVALRMFGVGGKVRAAILALAGAFVIGKYVAPDFTGSQVAGEQGSASQPRGFFGRLWEGAKRAMGFGGRDGSGGREQQPASGAKPTEGPMLDRSGFEEELKDPAVRQRLFAVTEAEVGSQGEEAQQAFMETIFNRARSRHQTLWQTLHGSYYPGSTHARAGSLMGDPRLDAKYRAIYERVLSGANITNGATGNASGGVGFGGGPETFRSGGEHFGVEGQDLPWWKREQQRQNDKIDLLIKKAPWGNPADQMTVPPLTSSEGDDFSVSTTRTTKIVVKGDTNPHQTAQDVTSAQRRINTDIITSTNRAFA